MTISTIAGEGGAVVLAISGDLDISTAGDVQRAGLQAFAVDGCRSLTVDLAGTEFMDSTGLAALVQLRNGSEASGRKLVLRDPGEQVRRVLALTALDAVFVIEES